LNNGEASYIRLSKDGNNYWNKRGDYLALWNSASAYDTKDEGSRFYLTKVEVVGFSEAVAISGHNIATFYANTSARIPEGVKAYVATKQPEMKGADAEGNATGVITMTELEGIIPAHTGAVLRGAADTYEFIPSISYGTAVEGNMLVGFEADNKDANLYREEALAEGYATYVLAVKNEKAGFYLKDADFNVYNNKAYLQVPATIAANSLAIRFEGDGSTGIDNSEFTIQNSEFIYDLMGRRVENPAKGVYIVNGKKVVIK
jgi:hypothetical protein